MSVYISSMARRAGAARGSRGSSASNRGGAAGGGAEKCEAGRAEVLPGEPGDSTRGGVIAEEQGAESGGGPGRSVYVAGCGSAAGGGGGGAVGGGGGGGGGGLAGGVCRGVCMSVQELSYCLCLPCCCTVLLQHGADPNIRNTDGKSALDLAEPSAKAVLTGQFPARLCIICHAHTRTHKSVHVCVLSVSLSVTDRLFTSQLSTSAHLLILSSAPGGITRFASSQSITLIYFTGPGYLRSHTILVIQSCVQGCTFSLFHSSVTIHGSEVWQCLLSFLISFLSPLTPLLAEAALTNQLLSNLALSCWILVAIVSLPSIPAFSLSWHETLRNNQRHALHPIDHTLFEGPGKTFASSSSSSSLSHFGLDKNVQCFPFKERKKEAFTPLKASINSSESFSGRHGTREVCSATQTNYWFFHCYKSLKAAGLITLAQR